MNTDNYARRQSARDAEYERQYREWIESLSPAERKQLEDAGVAEACVHRHGNGSAHGDASDSSIMSEGCDPALEVSVDEPEPTEQDTEVVWDTVRRVIGEILSRDNARLTVECLALVSGLQYTGAAMTEIARRHGVTRAAVSKRCVELTVLLDLRPSRAMRSLTARRRYRSARIRTTSKHELPAPAPESQGDDQPARPPVQR